MENKEDEGQELTVVRTRTQIMEDLGIAIVNLRKLTLTPESVSCQEVEFVLQKRADEESLEAKARKMLKAATKDKKKAGALFKAGKFAKASRKYEEVVEFLGCDEFFNEVEKKQSRDLKIACKLNNAASMLKLKNNNQATALCTEVLEMQSRNVRALCKRGQSSMNMGGLASAETDFKKALEIDPLNRELQVQFKKFEEEVKQRNKKDANMYRKMFPKGRKGNKPVPAAAGNAAAAAAAD